MTTHKRDAWLVSVDLSKDLSLPTRLKIWIDPVNQQWCIGPERGPRSTAILLKQVRGDVFVYGVVVDD